MNNSVKMIFTLGMVTSFFPVYSADLHAVESSKIESTIKNFKIEELKKIEFKIINFLIDSSCLDLANKPFSHPEKVELFLKLAAVQYIEEPNKLNLSRVSYIAGKAGLTSFYYFYLNNRGDEFSILSSQTIGPNFDKISETPSSVFDEINRWIEGRSKNSGFIISDKVIPKVKDVICEKSEKKEEDYSAYKLKVGLGDDRGAPFRYAPSGGVIAHSSLRRYK